MFDATSVSAHQTSWAGLKDIGYLPGWVGNLDIMTSADKTTVERIVTHTSQIAPVRP